MGQGGATLKRSTSYPLSRLTGLLYRDGKSATRNHLVNIERSVPFFNRRVINCEQPRRFLEMYYLTEVAHDDSVQCGNHMGHFHRGSDYPFDLSQHAHDGKR